MISFGKMISFLFVAYCWICYQATLASSVISDDGLCTVTRMVSVLDKFSHEGWPCEEYFSSFSCSQIRSGKIQMEEVFIPEEEKVCCHGSYLEDGSCQTCPEGLYGEDCKVPCTCVHASGNCNLLDGSCDCNEGWTGRDCDRRCPPGSFGRNCVNQTTSCLNGGTNDPATGVCLCPTKYQGEHCEEACHSGSCMVDCPKCFTPATKACDIHVSVCRCKDDWMGVYCTEPCPPGFMGPHCGDPCCSGNGVYDRGTKSCKCIDGYHGDECEEKCQEGTFGPNCQLECDCDKCDHVTGVCTECPLGFTGDRCTDPCSDGTWGPNCNQTCECNEGEECDTLAGACQKLYKPKVLSKVSNKESDLTITGGMIAVGGIILLLTVAVILLATRRLLTRKRHPVTEAEAFPSLSVKPESTHGRITDDYTKEESVYQEIDDYPLRYIKPALPSAPPGTPLEYFKAEKVVNYDPDYLVPDVKV